MNSLVLVGINPGAEWEWAACLVVPAASACVPRAKKGEEGRSTQSADTYVQVRGLREGIVAGWGVVEC